jgi:hypothetical protein
VGPGHDDARHGTDLILVSGSNKAVVGRRMRRRHQEWTRRSRRRGHLDASVHRSCHITLEQKKIYCGATLHFHKVSSHTTDWLHRFHSRYTSSRGRMPHCRICAQPLFSAGSSVFGEQERTAFDSTNHPHCSAPCHKSHPAPARPRWTLHKCP